MLAASRGPDRARGRVEQLTEPTADSLWDAIAGRLKQALSETTFETWFAHAEPRSLDERGLVVGVPNDFTRDWIESHFHGFVSAAARDSSGQDVGVSFVVSAQQVRLPEPAPSSLPAPVPTAGPVRAARNPRPPTRMRPCRNPRSAAA